MPAETYGYHARPDGHGGVTLVPNAPLQRAIDRARTRDAGFKLPGARAAGRQLASGKPLGDEDLDEPGAGSELDPSTMDPAVTRGQVIATLDPPEEGWVYTLEENEDGSFAVILTEADELGEALAADAANGHRHRLHGPNPVLDGMNKANRRFWDRRTHDAELRQTLFRHTPLPDERVELRKNADGSYTLLLISEVDDELYGLTPLGASGSFPGTRSTNQRPSATGDRRMTTADKLAEMNERHRRFWARR